jgi:hypothetical protein
MAQRGGTSLARGGGAARRRVGAVATALGYGLTVLLTRSFGPAEYGALGALLGVGLIGGIPAGALQYAVGPPDRRGRPAAGANERAGFGCRSRSALRWAGWCPCCPRSQTRSSTSVARGRRLARRDAAALLRCQGALARRPARA